MKLNKIILALGMAATLTAGVANAALPAAGGLVDKGHGTVTFTGSIIDAPCSITGDSTDQTVNLGEVSQNSLKSGGTSTPANFTIKLAACDTSSLTDGVSITFTGDEDTDTAGNLAFGAGSGAKGASIVLADTTGAKIDLGTESEFQAIYDGDNALNFQAYLQGSAASGATVTPGSFTSVANFALNYQ